MSKLNSIQSQPEKKNGYSL